jgi:hypothetical protein
MSRGILKLTPCFRLRTLFVIVLVAGVASITAWRWSGHLHTGSSPGKPAFVIMGMANALFGYANSHRWSFPARAATSDDCLRPLLDRGLISPQMFAADRNEPNKGPHRCGWIYVAGLSALDNSDLAVCWTKSPIAGYYGVVRVGAMRQSPYAWIDEREWPQFQREQEAMRRAIGRQSVVVVP